MSEEQKTHLANSIEIAEAKSKMDENAKQLLANYYRNEYRKQDSK